MECSDDSSIDNPGVVADSLCDLKSVITRLSNKKPELILGVLRIVLEMVEAKESSLNEKGNYYLCSAKTADIYRLCSFVHWLLLNLKALTDSDQISIISESSVISTNRNAFSSVSVMNLLHKIMSLSAVSEVLLSRSVLLLAEMVGNKSSAAKLKKIPLPVEEEEQDLSDSTFVNNEAMLLQEEASLKKATEELEILKSRVRDRSSKTTSSRTDTTNRKWTVVKSWIPCPIGMLPCFLSSTAILPCLDLETDEIKPKCDVAAAELHTVDIVNDSASAEKEAAAAAAAAGGDDDDDDDENVSGRKRLRVMKEEEELDLPEISSPMKGLLRVNGLWEKVSEDDLANMQSRIADFAKSVLALRD